MWRTDWWLLEVETGVDEVGERRQKVPPPSYKISVS